MHKYLLILFFLPAVCFSETSVWCVSKNGNELYLGGTIHMLKKDDYPLPVEFSGAFAKSAVLVLETDIEAARSPEFTKKINHLLTYPAGQSLREAISEKTFIKLNNYLTDRKLPMEPFLRYKPSMVVLAISVLELQSLGMVEIGVDEYYYNKARKVNKAIEYFETVDEQLEYLRTMGKGKEDEMILSTIEDMSRMKDLMAVIKSAWLNGDENKMAEAILTEMIDKYPDLYQSLLVKRNNKWMIRLEELISNKRIELVLVGALHLVGKDGLLQQLRNLGYEVKHFK